jgi:hypothetical protein
VAREIVLGFEADEFACFTPGLAWIRLRQMAADVRDHPVAHRECCAFGAISPALA